MNINHLMIQTSSTCVNNCKDCYLKNKYKNHSTRLSLYQLMEIFEATRSQQIIVQQITLSANRRGTTTDIAALPESIISSIHSAKQVQNFHLDVTAHTLDQVVTDLKHVGLYSLIDSLQITHGYSEENKPVIRMTKIPRKVLSNHAFFALVEDITHVRALSQYVIYTKQSVGSELIDPKKELLLVDQYIRLMHHLKTIPIPSKIYFDKCIEDCIDHCKNGTQCPSNVSSFHIWPDGSVSGCPYLVDGVTSSNLIESIKLCYQQSDFSRCYLPAMIQQVLAKEV